MKTNFINMQWTAYNELLWCAYVPNFIAYHIVHISANIMQLIRFRSSFATTFSCILSQVFGRFSTNENQRSNVTYRFSPRLKNWRIFFRLATEKGRQFQMLTLDFVNSAEKKPCSWRLLLFRTRVSLYSSSPIKHYLILI